MDFLCFTTCLSLFIAFCEGEGNFAKYDPKAPGFYRSNRKYNTPYGPPGQYGDDSDDADDTNDDSDSGPPSPAPSPTGKGPNYGNLKGFSYGQDYAPFYKGYPFNPYWKGTQKGNGSPDEADDSDSLPMNPLKMMEMLMMINAIDKIQESSKKETSGLSTFFSDSKSGLVAAVIPLSIVLVAVLPVLINYMMTGVSVPQVISTTANNKDARSIDGIDGANIIQEIVQNFEQLARAVDANDCLQKALCQVASHNSTTFGPHIQKAASSVANLIKDEWISNVAVKSLVNGLKHGDCENVCNISHPTPRQENRKNMTTY